MLEKVIEKYVNKLKKQDIINFAIKNDITLKGHEVDIIYENIKQYWKTIIFDDHNKILIKVKNKFDVKTYHKIKDLIILYKEKYKNYL